MTDFGPIYNGGKPPKSGPSQTSKDGPSKGGKEKKLGQTSGNVRNKRVGKNYSGGVENLKSFPCKKG